MATRPRRVQICHTSVRKPWQNRSSAPDRLSGRRLQKRNERIKERDGWRCQNRWCGALTIHLHIDHKVALTQGGTDDDDNLQALCIACNMAKASAESRGIRIADPSNFDREKVKRLGKKNDSPFDDE